MTIDSQEPKDRLSVGPITELGSREKQGLNSAITNAIPDAMPESFLRQQPVIISNGRRSSNDQSSIIDRAYNEGKRLIQDAELPRAAQYTLNTQGKPPSTTTSQPATRPLPEKRYGSYKVVEGDSLIKIARKALGNGERWSEIHELNADVLGPDAILKIGVYLKLPSDAKKVSMTKTRSRGSVSSSKTYTVKSGDTLGQISMELLGTSRRADEIAELNGLESANDIRIGMKLDIPAK